MRIDPHENIKAWLRRYRELQADAGRLWDRLEDLRVRVESARTAHLDGLPHGSRGDADRIGADLSRLEDLEQEAREVQQEATTSRRAIEAAIRKISGRGWADWREVLRLRYIDGLRWEDVSEHLFGDNPDFWNKPELFLRRTFKLHKAALEELEKLVPLQVGREND